MIISVTFVGYLNASSSNIHGHLSLPSEAKLLYCQQCQASCKKANTIAMPTQPSDGNVQVQSNLMPPASKRPPIPEALDSSWALELDARTQTTSFLECGCRSVFDANRGQFVCKNVATARAQSLEANDHRAASEGDINTQAHAKVDNAKAGGNTNISRQARGPKLEARSISKSIVTNRRTHLHTQQPETPRR